MYFSRSSALAPEDARLPAEYLNDRERELFQRMDRPDQEHSIRVARVCAQSLENHPQVDRRAMMRAALLHDVGKIDAGLGLVFRTFWVLVKKLMPQTARAVALRGAGARPGSLRHKMWLQVTHAELGAQTLREMGVEEKVCELTVATGEPKQADDSIDKRMIIAADGDKVLPPGFGAQ